MQDGQELYRSRHLGVGTSAMAEVQGMALAAEFFLENEPDDDLPLFFFTDSRAAIKVATGAKTPWWCAEARRLRELVTKVAETRRVVCFWVPAHAGLRENEVVDRLARRGATGADSDAEATPDDEHDIPQEELVVAAALGKRDIALPFPLDGPDGVLRDNRGPRARRAIGEVCGRQDRPGGLNLDDGAQDAPT